MVVAEVHHGEEGIHHARTQPFLSILADHRSGIPPTRRITAQVVGFADGRATHHHPGLQSLHPLADSRCDGGDVASALLARHLYLPRFRIADVVEMDAVDIVVAHDFLADVGEIRARLHVLRVHVAIGANLLDESRIALAKLRATGRRPFAHGNRHHPRMQLHAALVALVDGELQRIVARTLPGIAAQTAVPRLHAGGIDGGGTHAGLKEHHVCADSLQLVENGGEFPLLPFYGRSRAVGVGVRPVDAADSGEPYCAHFVLRRGSKKTVRGILLLKGWRGRLSIGCRWV